MKTALGQRLKMRKQSPRESCRMPPPERTPQIAWHGSLREQTADCGTSTGWVQGGCGGAQSRDRAGEQGGAWAGTGWALGGRGADAEWAGGRHILLRQRGLVPGPESVSLAVGITEKTAQAVSVWPGLNEEPVELLPESPSDGQFEASSQIPLRKQVPFPRRLLFLLCWCSVWGSSSAEFEEALVTSPLASSRLRKAVQPN